MLSKLRNLKHDRNMGQLLVCSMTNDFLCVVAQNRKLLHLGRMGSAQHKKRTRESVDGFNCLRFLTFHDIHGITAKKTYLWRNVNHHLLQCLSDGLGSHSVEVFFPTTTTPKKRMILGGWIMFTHVGQLLVYVGCPFLFMTLVTGLHTA